MVKVEKYSFVVLWGFEWFVKNVDENPVAVTRAPCYPQFSTAIYHESYQQTSWCMVSP